MAKGECLKSKCDTVDFTLNVGRQPTGFAKLAWNVLKFTNIYAAKKKFDISGAIAFNSPIKINLQKTKACGMSSSPLFGESRILTQWK